MIQELPYCGAAAIPGELLGRFNPDPVVIIALLVAAVLQLWRKADRPAARVWAAWGWVVAAAAFVSPLCALSVSLFSARVAQHMILVLVAAPLVALGMPLSRTNRAWSLWGSALTFFFALWFWHMPVPYEATFRSVAIYWCMHVSLFGSAVWLWRELLQSSPQLAVETFAAGALTSIHMGLLGAVLALGAHPLFSRHLMTTWVWNLTPLEDQQLGGVIMWAPGIVLFLWTAMRSLRRLWVSLERVRTT
jgi:putative membrane protein